MAGIVNRDGTLNLLTLSSSFEQRELLRKYVDVTDDEMGMFDWMDFTNRAVVTGNVEYEHVIESTLYQLGVVAVLSTVGTAGVDKVITFSGTAAKPFQSETVLFKNGVSALVVLVVPNGINWDVTLRPLNAASIIPACAVNESVSLKGNAQAEGSRLDEAMRQPTLIKRKNNVQLFSNVYKITDLAGSTVVEIPFNGKNYVLEKAKFQNLLRHRMDISNELKLGTKGQTTDSQGNKVWTTGGLRTEVKSLGFNMTSASAGTWNTIQDQRALSILMDSQRCPGGEYMLFAGQTLNLAIDVDGATNTAFTGGGISFAAYGGNEKIALAIGTKSITMGGRVIHISRDESSQHPGISGSAGFDLFKKEGYLIPTNKVKTIGGDGVVDRLRTRYMNFNGEKDLRYLIVEEGALSPNKTNANRSYTQTLMSNQGLELTGHEHFGIITVQ